MSDYLKDKKIFCGQIHEVINNSKKPLVFICLTIPWENDKNTIYLK